MSEARLDLCGVRLLPLILLVAATGPLARGQAPIAELQGDSANQRFGTSVAIVGDVDGDGFDDFVVGAPAGSGFARVFSGRDRALLFQWNGDPGDSLGASVSGPGDLDQDGYADVLVGATGNGTRAIAYSGRDGTVLH